MRHLSLTLLLLSAVAFALVRPGPTPVQAEEPKPGTEKEGEGDPSKDPGKGEEEVDDFFEGETSFTKEQVEKAIKKGVDWLRKRQDGDGGWGPLGAGNRAYGGGESTGRSYDHPA